MQVVKRDGHIVDFDRSKIIIAIQKANDEVDVEERSLTRESRRLFQELKQRKEREFWSKIFRISSSMISWQKANIHLQKLT